MEKPHSTRMHNSVRLQPVTALFTPRKLAMHALRGFVDTQSGCRISARTVAPKDQR